VRYSSVRGGMKDNGFSLRVHMVELARLKGIGAAAREMKTSRLTVRKWLVRYQNEGLSGLKEHSRARKTQRKIPSALEEKIRQLRLKYRWGPLRLKMQCGLPCSAGAIYRVIRQAGLIRKRVPKWKHKRDLRERKKKMAPFEKIQVDVKDLSDIPAYWPAPSGECLPRYEYTAREVRTGAAFVAYAHANNGTSAAAFASYLVGHLEAYGVDLSEMRIQSDNGSEFIGSVKKKTPEPSDFERVLQLSGVRHERIPPARSTWNSDVETFHRTVEDELYAVEPLRNRGELLGKAYTYQLFYNHFRKNRWRDFQSPREILDSLRPGQYDPGVFSLPPAILDNLLTTTSPGNHVTGSPTRIPD
jgi:transposase